MHLKLSSFFLISSQVWIAASLAAVGGHWPSITAMILGWCYLIAALYASYKGD